MDACDVSAAVNERGHWEEQCRTQQICHLETNVVFAVAICRHFQQSLISVPVKAELLREHGMCDLRVLWSSPAICHYETNIIFTLEKMVEVRADILNRRGVESCWVDGLPYSLNPDSPDDLRVVLFEKAHKLIQKSEVVADECLSAQPKISSDFGSLDLRTNTV